MTQPEPPGDEADATSEGGSIPIAQNVVKSAAADELAFLEAVKRPYTEIEVANPLTVRFLVDRISDLRKEINQLKPYETRFYESDRDLQVERGRGRLDRRVNLLADLLVVIAAAGLGTALNSFNDLNGVRIMTSVLCAILIAGAFYLKAESK